jgi:hypothetical protein
MVLWAGTLLFFLPLLRLTMMIMMMAAAAGVLALSVLNLPAYAFPSTWGNLTGYGQSKIALVVAERNGGTGSCREDQVKATHIVATDQRGNFIKQTTTDSQVLLRADLASMCASAQPAILIFEVRDAQGVTKYLSWQTLMVGAQKHVTTRVSWLAPDVPGAYEVRFFKISCLQCPMVLSQVLTYRLDVLPPLP